MKKTLVILPGWGGSSETWKEFIEIAKSDFDVVCIDLPCFGTEPCPSEVWGVEEYADFVNEKIVKLLNGKIVLFGHSFGGQVAAYLASKKPEYVEKLLLSGPALFRPKRKFRRILFGAIAKMGTLLFKLPMIEEYSIEARKLLHRAAGTPDYGDTSGVKRDIFKKIIRQDLADLLPGIDVPTLLLWGGEDSYVPVGDAARAKALIPNAEAHIFDNGRHGLHLERPHELYDVVRRFSYE